MTSGPMAIDPREYSEIATNPHGIAAGSLLLPTRVPIVMGGGTSLDFVLEQGGSEETFVFMLGARGIGTPLGKVQVLEGVFLDPGGPGFHPTWDLHQLMREVAAGGWKVIPTAEVLASDWVARVEQRMNA